MEQGKTKKLYTSRTLWVNGIAFIALIAQGIAGREVIDTSTQMALLALVNGLLRLVTKTELV